MPKSSSDEILRLARVPYAGTRPASSLAAFTSLWDCQPWVSCKHRFVYPDAPLLALRSRQTVIAWENGQPCFTETLEEVQVDSSVQQNFAEIFADEEA